MKYKSFILATCILFSSAGTISAKGKKVLSWLDATVKAKTEIQAKLKEKKNVRIFFLDTKRTKAGTFHRKCGRYEKTCISNHRWSRR